MTVDVAYGNKISFIDTASVVWNINSRRNDCVVEIKADARLNPCATLLTGMIIPEVPCGVVTQKDTICSAIAKLQCQVSSGGVQSVTDDGSGVVVVDNTDPQNPIVGFGGVNVDGVTITGDGSVGSPLTAIAGAGSVTYVSSGNLSPLFTVNVATPNSTPAFTFTAVSQSPHLVYASPIIGAGVPSFRQLNFIELGDVPQTYAGSAFDFPMVNLTEDGMVFGNLFGAANNVVVDVATTGNVVLSGNQLINGVLNPARVLVWQNTVDSENGAWATSAGAWTRMTNADTAAELNDEVVYVIGGTLYAARYFNQIETVVTVNTDPVNYQINAIGGAGGNNWKLQGNNAPVANILGTINNRTVNIRTNNLARGSWDSSGNMNWGSSSQFVINSSGRITKYDNAAPTNGQLLIGDTAAGYFKTASLTAGAGISITPGAGSITIAASATGAISWLLDGNTVGSIKWIGTVDNFDFPMRTNSVENARLFTTGQFGVGIAALPFGRLHVQGATSNTTANSLYITNAAGSTVIVTRNDCSWAVGLNASNSLPNQNVLDVNINGVIGANATSNSRIAIGGSSDFANSLQVGYLGSITQAGGTAIGAFTSTSAKQSGAFGFQVSSSGAGSYILGGDFYGTITNNIPRSFMLGLGGSSDDLVSVLHQQSFFVNFKTNVVLNGLVALVTGTNYDTYTSNTLTVHDGSQGTVETITGITTAAGKAQLTYNYSNQSLIQFDIVVLSGFAGFPAYNGTWYLRVDNAQIYPTRADAIALTNAQAFLGNDTGTMTPQVRNPTMNIANAYQLYSVSGQPWVREASGATFQIAAPTGGSVPAGTTGQTLYYAAAGTTVTATSNLYNSGTGIGINVVPLINALHIASASETDPILRLDNQVGEIDFFLITANSTPEGIVTGDVGDIAIVNRSTLIYGMYIKADNGNTTSWQKFVTEDTSGNVIITGKLTVAGAIDPTHLYLDEQGGDPANVANKGILYTKDVGALTQLFYMDSAGTVKNVSATGTGTVTTVSVVTANGASGSVATDTTTPAITLSFTTQAAGDNSTKVATTAYVDNAILGQNFKEAVKYATTAALPAVVYANGSSGVGATLTGVAVGALSLDSQTPSVGDRILVKNQVSTFQNGLYTVTAVGSGIAVFVMTRATDFDQAADIRTGDSVFITSGTTQSLMTWAYTGIDSPVMGTTAITFVQTAGQSANASLSNLSAVAINTDLILGTSDGGALGSVTKMWSDLFLASGGVINFNAGDVLITHSANLLAFSGATSGYTFDVPIDSASGGTGINNAGRTLTISTNSGTISYTSSVTLTVAAAASISGTNTGDQTIAGLSPLTTKGDLFTFSTVNTRLAVGATNGQILQVASGAATGLAWSTPTYPSASGTAGKVLRSDGTNNVYSTFTIPDTFAVGDIIQASATSVFSALASVATGNVLISGGVTTVSSWGKVALTTHVSGVLPIANGGSNKALTLVTGGVLWTDADSFEVTAAGTQNQVLISNVTAAPSWADNPIGILMCSMGAGNTIPLSTTSYSQFFFGNSVGTNETQRNITIRQACTIKNLTIRTSTTQDASGALVITVRKNSGATTVTVTLIAGQVAGTFTDTTHSFAMAAGDLMCIQYANAATATSANVLEASVWMYL